MLTLNSSTFFLWLIITRYGYLTYSLWLIWSFRVADVVVVDVVCGRYDCGRYGTDPGISHCLETGYPVVMLRVYRPTYCIF